MSDDNLITCIVAALCFPTAMMMKAKTLNPVKEAVTNAVIFANAIVDEVKRFDKSLDDEKKTGKEI